MKNGIQQMIGKRVSGIITAENRQNPKQQVFLIFDDDTYFEFYGDSFTGSGGVMPGSAADAVEYATKIMGARIGTVYPESLLKGLQKPQV